MRVPIIALLVAALCVQIASGTVLVRFINTVPNTLETPTAFSQKDHLVTPGNGYAASASAAPARYKRSDTFYEYGSTRVGLEYAENEDKAKFSTVWTEPSVGFGMDAQGNHGLFTQTSITTTTSLDSVGTSLYLNGNIVTEKTFAYQMAMPPLRAYHDHSGASAVTAGTGQYPTATGNIVAVDRVAHYQQCMHGAISPGGYMSGYAASSCFVCTDTLGCTGSQAADYDQDTSNGHIDSATWDTMDHEGLKADGISQYLTFAAGTYKFKAYGIGGSQLYPDTTESPAGAGGTTTTSLDSAARGVLSVTTANANLLYSGVAGVSNPGAGYAINTRTILKFAASEEKFTFEDGHTYTIVATGSVTWPSTTSGNTVKLSLVDESVAPTTFGKASIRFFHAIQPRNDEPITIYNGETTTELASSLVFGKASSYVDVAPSTSTVLRVSSTSGVTSQTSTTADIRAGTRATIICAVNDLSTNAVFCRQIPSRVVAYVRLVNDFESINNHIAGAAGPTPLKNVEIALYGQYDYPTASVLSMSSMEGSMSSNPANPIGHSGLYPVIGNTAAGSVTGYGEVHVPLFVMDKAVSQNIFMSGTGDAVPGTAPILAGANSANAHYPGHTAGVAVDLHNVEMYRIAGFQSDLWETTENEFATGCNSGASYAAGACARGSIGAAGRPYAPRYKRVNLILKTSGFATINDNSLNRRSITAISTALLGLKDGQSIDFAPQNLLSSSTDIPMEPGQYYTFYATAQMGADLTPTLAGAVTAGTNTQADGTPSDVTGTTDAAGNRDGRRLPGVEDDSWVILNGVSSGTLINNPANGRIIEFGLTLDRTIDQLSAGLPAGKGTLRFLPFGMVSEGHALIPNGLIDVGNAGGRTLLEGARDIVGVGYAELYDTQLKLPYSGQGSTASTNYDAASTTTPYTGHLGSVYIRQFHNAYGAFDGTIPHQKSGTAPPPSKLPTITISTDAGVAVETDVNPLTNYVRLDPYVFYIASLKPMYDNAIELDAGKYKWQVQNANWKTDPCMFSVPAVPVDIKEGDFLTVFVLNYLGCRTSKTSDDSNELHTVVVGEFAASATPTASSSQETFFGAASSVTASMALLFAGVLAILAVAL